MTRKRAGGRAKATRSRPARAPDAPEIEGDRARHDDFPIVGIGASAGGLEALELFLDHVPKDSRIAWVVVQHMDPGGKSMLVELLRRRTSMPVAEITDRMRVEANHVYVIPPNHDLSLLHGKLHLLEPDAPRGLRLPIDFFFRSLAQDLEQRSVGVILSGMGSDGTIGVRAIKEKGGAVFVQAPTSAKFAGMPTSAVDAGVCDVVAPAEELPTRIASYLSQMRHPSAQAGNKALHDEGALEKIFILLRARTGHDFALYKKSTVQRRIERRMVLHQLREMADYLRFLRENPQEQDLLFGEMLIGVTSFFRDPSAWEEVRTEVMPELMERLPQGGQLRAWVPACSTGEEAYTLAMLFREALDVTPQRSISLQIFATDLDKRAIDKARAGTYPAGIAADVSAERLNRFFVEDGSGFRVSKEIRDLVIFAPQNVIMDPPFPRLDFLSCRNLLIYLEPELQKNLLKLFHYSLNPGGFLLLGSAEAIGSATSLFALQPGAARLYRRLDVPLSVGDLALPLVARRPHVPLAPTTAEAQHVEAPHDIPNVQTLADHVLLQSYAPAAVLATASGDIVYIHGKTGKYLEPAAGKANWNLFAMARDGLGGPLLAAFRQALAQRTTVRERNLRVGTNGGTVLANVTIEPLSEPAALSGMAMVVFEEATDPLAISSAPQGGSHGTGESASTEGPSPTDHTQALAELDRMRAELRGKTQQMETAREEARAASEELLSTNEELQSTNEELTASKEEMQSMNEELQTVNHELQAKLDELSRTSNDMKNLLNATDIATLFLDSAMRVRHFTPQVSKVIKLIPSDVGRVISDLASDLSYPDLVSDAQSVLSTLLFRERTVSARDDRWFTVRIMPYATQDNRIDEVVVTFSDVSTAKRLEADLRTTEAKLRSLLAVADKNGTA